MRSPNLMSFFLEFFFFYHDVDLGFPFLDDKSPSKSNAFITIVFLHSLPHTAYETVLSCPPAGSDLYDL